ncbi:MAG: flavin reductase family protein [Clostridiales bacterium]|nr:flavin reductase family protein [Clostridiales bacterium]
MEGLCMFREINPYDLKKTPFEYIGKDWALLTARKADGSINTMTVSWGGMGVLWNKNVFFCFVRPTRHTFAFTEEAKYISLCFFDEDFRKKLSLCGTKSGRDTDKIKECGFTVRKDKGIYYEECRLALIGRKIYSDTVKRDNFIDENPDKWYKDDFHTMYVCEIEKILIRD